MKSLRGGPFFAFSLPGGRCAPLLPVSYAAAHSRKVQPPKPRVKAKSSLSGRNYFITMHHQAGVNFENFTEVKFRDISLTGTEHRDRRSNRDSPGQTYGRSNLNQNVRPKSNFRSIRERPICYSFFWPKVPPPRKVPPQGIAPLVRPLTVGGCCHQGRIYGARGSRPHAHVTHLVACLKNVKVSPSSMYYALKTLSFVPTLVLRLP